uniref:Aminotransferase-like plant mobile domain-containing protein n=1 Tax=Oryza glumipatula TaxID=40148 RepID=A0A0E0BUC2_9ORYZ
MRQMGMYQQVPVPVGLHLPPDVHTQKRQADNRYRRSMHSRMTPWIEVWSQVLNDVVQETRAYDHNTYEQYMAWCSSQTLIRLLAPEDPDEQGPPTIDQIYDMQLAPPAHLTTDIAGELVRDAKTLWEKLRDGMAGTNQEVMAAVDSLHRKRKRIMRLASCRHSSDVYTPATSRKTFEPMPERPSTSSRPSTSARPSASARRSSDGRAGVRSTSFREPHTIPTIPEITEISERLGGFGSTQAQPERVPPHSSTPITSQWQGGFASGNANGPSRASYASCKATNDSSNGSRCANLTLARRICTFCKSVYIQYHIGIHMSTRPTQSVPLHASTYGTNPWQGQSMDYGGSFCPELMSGFRPYTASYGDMSSFGGGSSSVPNELRTSQTDDAPPVTQPTQPEVGEGNDNDLRRSNRERHEPNRLSLSGPRHAAGQRKKTTKKRGGTSRTTTNHDDDDE